jgi:hypothetical protein
MSDPEPQVPPAPPTRQQLAFLHYHHLLNEIQALGMDRFVAMIDASTDEELTDLLTAANVVRLRIRSFQTKATP